MRVQDVMIVIVTIGCSAALATSQGGTAPTRGAIERGRAVFEQNCATCHSKRGKGAAPGGLNDEASTNRPDDADQATWRLSR